MKRVISFILAAAMLLSLAACTQPGGETTPNPTAQPTQEQGATVADNAPDLRGKTITILTRQTWVSGVNLSDILPRFKQVEERTGVKIVWQTASSDYMTVVQTRLAGDIEDCPDIVLMDPSTAYIVKFTDEGILYDVTQAYDVCPNIKRFFECRDDLRQQFTYNGGIYNLPTDAYLYPDDQAKWVSFEGDNALWYRADIAEKLGFTSYPKTLDELHALLVAVKQNYPDMIPMHMWNWGSWESVRIFNSAFGLHFNNEQSAYFYYPDKNGVIQFEPSLPACKAWLEVMHQWYSEGLIVLGPSEEQKIGNAAQGKSFSGFFASVHAMCEKPLKQNEPDAYFMYMPFPSQEGYETTVMPRGQYENFIAIVDNGSEQARAAAQFLDYAFFSDYGIFCEKAGVQGEGWDYDKDGNFLPDEDYIASLITGDNVLEKSGAHIHFNGPSVQTYDSALLWKEMYESIGADLGLSDMNEAQLANWKEINSINASHYCETYPNMFLNEADNDRFNALMADIGTYTEEMLEKFMIGIEDLDNFDAFVNTLYTRMHLQEAIDIQQRAYDTVKGN